MSASWSRDDCAEARGDLDSDMSVADLSANPVDHGPIEPRLDDTELPNLAGATLEEHGTPFLYLTPRVESVLRGIFDAENDASPAMIDAPTSTLAEIDADLDFDQTTDKETPDSGSATEDTGPVFQQQMYRIDI